MNGHSGEFALELADLSFGVENVQKAVRNYTGLFWLTRRPHTGRGLRSTARAFPSVNSGAANRSLGEGVWRDLGLLDKAELGHTKPTASSLETWTTKEWSPARAFRSITTWIEGQPFETGQSGSAKYASAMERPARGRDPGRVPRRRTAPVKIHYACGIGHSKEPGTQGSNNGSKGSCSTAKKSKAPMKTPTRRG